MASNTKNSCKIKNREITWFSLDKSLDKISIITLLIEDFNYENNSSLGIYDIKAQKIFDAFVDFLGENIDNWRYRVTRKQERLLFFKLGECKKEDLVEKYIEQIEKSYHLWWENLAEKDKVSLRAAYNLMEHAFFNVHRSQKNKFDLGKKIKYFSHLVWVFNILLDNGLIPNINQAITVLLHDFQEDIPFINKDNIKLLFNEEVATWVDNLSKQNWSNYQNFLPVMVDNKILNNTVSNFFCKSVRDHIYFDKELWLNELPIKLADRLHNLKTLDGLALEKILKTVLQTEWYFFTKSVEKRAQSLKAESLYKSLKSQIKKLKVDYFNTEKKKDLYEKTKIEYKTQMSLVKNVIDTQNKLEELPLASFFFEKKRKKILAKKEQLYKEFAKFKKK